MESFDTLVIEIDTLVIENLLRALHNNTTNSHVMQVRHNAPFANTWIHEVSKTRAE